MFKENVNRQTDARWTTACWPMASGAKNDMHVQGTFILHETINLACVCVLEAVEKLKPLQERLYRSTGPIFL